MNSRILLRTCHRTRFCAYLPASFVVYLISVSKLEQSLMQSSYLVKVLDLVQPFLDLLTSRAQNFSASAKREWEIFYEKKRAREQELSSLRSTAGTGNKERRTATISMGLQAYF